MRLNVLMTIHYIPTIILFHSNMGSNLTDLFRENTKYDNKAYFV